jgi:hypothetical protein
MPSRQASATTSLPSGSSLAPIQPQESLAEGRWPGYFRKSPSHLLLLWPPAAFAATTTHIPFSRKNRRGRKELRLASSHQPLLPASPFCAPLRLLRPQQHHLIISRKDRRARKELRPPSSHQPLLPASPSCALLRLLRPKQHHPIFSRKNRRGRKELRLASSRQPFPSSLPFLRPLAAFAATTAPPQSLPQ